MIIKAYKAQQILVPFEVYIAGVAAVLTGAAAHFIMKDIDGLTVEEGACTIGTGTVTYTITPAKAAALGAGKFTYSIRVWLASGATIDGTGRITILVSEQPSTRPS